MTDPAGQVAAHWGNSELTQQLARVQWMSLPVVQLHLNERSTGSRPRRFQFSDALQEIINELLRGIPERFRRIVPVLETLVRITMRAGVRPGI